MQHLEDNIVIDAPLAEVFDYVTNPKHAPEWIPSMVEVTNVKGQGNKMQYDWVFKMVGFRLSGTTHVTKFEKNKLFEHRSERGIKSTWKYQFQRTDGETRVRLGIEYDVPTKVGKKVAEKILLRQHRREMDLALHSLKELIEFEHRGEIAAE